MKEKINVAVIGLGGRGQGMKNTLNLMDDVNIIGVCDVYQDRMEKGVQDIVDSGKPAPFGTTNYMEILEMDDLDGVYIATDWETHVKIAIEAMKHGIKAGMEVGGAYTLDECWELVDTYEQTGVWTMMMENCCYGERELMVRNMVNSGMFGKVVYCSGKYAHDLRDEIGYGEKNRHYRLRNYIARNCENYPTHELGPIAKLLDINRGNRFTTLISVCSEANGMHAYMNKQKDLKDKYGETVFNQADVVKTFIKTERGEMIELTLDTTLPRYYSRGFTVRGTKGMYQEDGDTVFLDKKSFKKKEWTQKSFWGRGKRYAQKWNHPLWKSITKEMMELGHGGIDWFVLRAWVEAIKTDTLPPLDVYDAAAWMSITPLSEKSIKEGSSTLEIPDFTRGKYLDRKDFPADNLYNVNNK